MDVLGRFQFKFLQAKYSLQLSIFPEKSIVINGIFKPHGLNLMNENWGDDINIILPTLISGKTVIPYNLLFPWIKGKTLVNYMCIGSIINWLTTQNSVIWGSGAINADYPLLAKPQKVLAVRGPMTRDFLLSQGINCPKVYGDPALLLPKYYNPNFKEKYRIGLIPHVSERDHEIIQQLAINKEIKIIDLRNYNNDWRNIIDQINQCEMIVSSSLHGLIIAEAYNIPNVWIRLSNKIIGGEFKYHDFFKSIGQDREAMQKSEIKINRIEAQILKWRKKKIDLTQQLMDYCPFIQ
ncbi:polysaccharide pyruvyl transferase family protein [Duncaniella muris]|uniref:polysaccharide pyruvyl transferase family protein n=1 Tax=Duncaniella muris TaxID=2094150 RepID=UPI001C3E08C5|nr:polysaccharide pyruvyl transferase family protein [Duncaniella muris]